MSVYTAPEVFDASLNYIKTHCNQVLAVIAYTKGDSYAAVTAPANVIASVAMAAADFTVAAGAAGAREMTSATKSAQASSAGNPTHFVFVDTTTSKVLWVAEEATAGAAVVGTPVQFPACTFTLPEPVAA